MATRVAMPSLGMVMTEGTIARWIAADGATVARGQPIVEIETDKLTHQIEAPGDGVVRHAAPEGTVLPVEGLIGWLLVSGEVVPGEGGLGPGVGEAVAAAGPPGDGGRGSGVGGARPHPGQPTLRAGSPLPEGEATGSPAAAWQAARVQPLSLGWPAASAALGSRPTALAAGSPLAGPRPAAPVSPAARRLAREHGLDLSRIRGTGPGGRIVEADVQAAVGGVGVPQPPGPGPQPPTILRRVPLTGMRRAIAERMTASLATGAQLTLSREVDASALVAAREALRGSFETLPYDAFFVKALAAALIEDPALNAVIEGDPSAGSGRAEIVVLGEVDVGVAVAVPGGLVVPVVRNAAARSLADIARTLADLSARARAGQLSLDDLAGGTVTITNLGGQGVDVFTPILNPPQSAILGIGRIAPRPVVVAGDALAVRPTVHLSLTFDHRVADGVPAAELVGRVARLLGDSSWLMAEG